MTKRKLLLSIIGIFVLAICSVFLFTGCANAKDVVENVVNDTVYAVTFDANGGTGTMEADTSLGNYTLPKSTFAAPAGKEFKCWLVGTSEKEVGVKITLEEDTSIKAVWKDITPVTAKMLKVIYTEQAVQVGCAVDQTKVAIKCVYSDGTIRDVALEDVKFYMGTDEITDEIDEVIPTEGVYDITLKYAGLEATMRIVVYKEYGEIFEMDEVNNIGIIRINFNNMRTEEDLYAIFSPSIENVGIRMDDDGLALAYDQYGNVIGAEITGTGAWFRFRQPDLKHSKYGIELTIDTSDMKEGEVVRFHGDEAVSWAGDFATIEKSNTLQKVKYTFEANDEHYITIKVYVNDILVGTAVSTATDENFLSGTANACEGICWAVYDFGEGVNLYSGGAVITSMLMTEEEIGE